MNKYEMTLRQINFDKPLREYYSTHETKEMLDCIRLYNEKKLNDFQPEDIRKLISQHVCIEETVPLCFEILRNNEMIKTEHFSGDLLSALVRVEKRYWIDHVEEHDELQEALNMLKQRIDLLVEIFL